MKDAKQLAVLITCKNEEEAQRVAEELVAQRKAACVNILARTSSLYWWRGEMESAPEVLLIAKTKASALNEVIDLVKKVHSYQTPEIIALPIIGGNREYLDWVNKEVK